MERTYVICHMLQSIDGRISGQFFQSPLTQSLAGIYGQMSKSYNADALIYGRTTADELFTHGHQLRLDIFNNKDIQIKDCICIDNQKKWIVVVDPLGTLGWNKETLNHEKLKDKNLIIVLSEKVSKKYIYYLQTLNISYIFAGKEELCMKKVLDKLYEKCHIQLALLQGGGIVNESFANENLIDELSLIISPVIEGKSGIPTIFETGQLFNKLSLINHYHLVKTKILPHSGLWVNYVKE